MDNKEAIAVLKSNYPHGRVMLSEAVDLSIKSLEAAESQTTAVQQLKAEILPLLTDALEEFSDNKFEHGRHYLEQAMAKLSAV